MLRLATQPDEVDDGTEESVTVAEAARRLGCDQSTVRAMLQRGDLGGHRVGKGPNPRGVRVDAASIKAYKKRHAIQASNDPAPASADPRPVRTSGHIHAKRRLRALGVL